MLDDDTVLVDVGEGDILVHDVGDGTGGALDGLDAYAIVGVLDDRAEDAHGLDDIVVAAANGADGETVAAAAAAAREGDVLDEC